MRRHLISCLLVCLYLPTLAQIHLKANLQNNHLWRGMEVADGAVVLSDLSYTFAKGHATVGLWGGTNTNGTYKEFNHYLSFSSGGFSLALWDTYNFSPGTSYNNHEYFNYSAHSTGRFLDCTVAYKQCGSFPLQLSWSTILFGRDRDATNSKQRYSTFIYAECPVYQQKDWEVKTGIGGAFALRNKDEGQHFYGNMPGIIHLTLSVGRKLQLGTYQLPVYVLGMWNPQSSKAYFQIGAEIFHF